MSFNDLSAKLTAPPKGAANDTPKTGSVSGEPAKAPAEEAAKPKTS